jgi:MGT family glycosyltransferase
VTDAAHIAFFTYPAHSHLNPTLPVVAELVRRGHRVSYVVAEQYAAEVASTGADVVAYTSRAPRSWNEVAIPADVTGDDLAQATLLHLTDALCAADAAEPVFADDRPDLFVYDAFGYAAGRLLARQWNVPSALTCTTFVANERYSPYAKLVETGPAMDPGHPALVEYTERLTTALTTHGLGRLSIQDFTTAAEDLNLVFVPSEFQPEPDTFDDRFEFVGPCIGERGSDGDWRRPDGDDPVALVAMGSWAYENQVPFFRQCVEAFDGLPWHLVLAIGGVVHPDDLGPLPANVEVRRWVPQLSVLAEASAFVSHGGMNSVMESLSLGLPPLVVARTGEQALIGERVAELGLGRALPATEVTADSLRATVLDLADDRETWRRAAEFAARLAANDGAARAADRLEARTAAPGTRQSRS